MIDDADPTPPPVMFTCFPAADTRERTVVIARALELWTKLGWTRVRDLPGGKVEIAWSGEGKAVRPQR